MSILPTSRRAETGTGRPFIFAVDCPCTLISRRSMRLSSRGMSYFSSAAKIRSGTSVKTAATEAFSSPWRTSSLSALAPSASSIASRMMDLPAPVSPVSTVKGAEKAIFSVFIIAILFIHSSESILPPPSFIYISAMLFSMATN